MRNVVMYEDFQETEIRPDVLVDKYLLLLERELSEYDPIKKKLVAVNCPACLSRKKTNVFKKFGFQYAECLICKSLYVVKRPTQESLADFYRISKAINFYKKEFVKKTSENRDAIIFKPRAQWIADTVEEYFPKPNFFVDIKSSYGVFLEEICALNLFEKKVSIEPRIDRKSSCFADSKFEYFEKPIELYPSSAIEVVTMFEILDRLFSPNDYITNIARKMVEESIIFITTPTISGFDLQILWDKAKTIFPPDHLNILSIEGIEILLDKVGFEIIELSTPGRLDVELVKKALRDMPKLYIPRFFDYILNTRDKGTQHAFQNFLQEQRLSSHLRLAAKKRKGK